MRTLENNDFMILNNLIYKIHTDTDFPHMQKELLEQLRMIINYDSADFYLSEGGGKTALISQVTYNCHYDLSKQFEGLDYSKGIMNSGKCLVYRESDILKDENRIQTDYYKQVYKVNNWHYALQCILSYNQEFLGVVTFYRTLGKKDYEYSDIFLLDMIKDHLAHRIYMETCNINGKISIPVAVTKYALTKKEHLVLELIMQGLSNEKICEINVISNNTLKKHIYNIYQKIGIKNKVQLFKLIKEYNPKVV